MMHYFSIVRFNNYLFIFFIYRIENCKKIRIISEK